MKNLYKLIEMIQNANARDIKLHIRQDSIILKAVAEDYALMHIFWDLNNGKLEFVSASDSVDQEHTTFGECVKAVFNIDSKEFLNEAD